MKYLNLFKFLTLSFFLIPAVLYAQSPYACDCSADNLNCSDFATPSEAQDCFWYCGSQGAGDIHQLDLDMNAVACDTVAATPVPTTIYVPPTPIPTAMSIPTATPVPFVQIPTAAPAYEVCACGGDYYDCSTFSGPSHAQGCFDYCVAQGAGDVHQMDPDGNGLACIASAAASVPPTPIPPTPIPTTRPVLVYIEPTPTPTATAMPISTNTPISIMSTPTPIPTATLEIVSWIATSQAKKAASCYCAGDAYNCSTFIYQSSAQICHDECIRRVGYDIHRLDRDNDGRVCEWLR